MGRNQSLLASWYTSWTFSPAFSAGLGGSGAQPERRAPVTARPAVRKKARLETSNLAPSGSAQAPPLGDSRPTSCPGSAFLISIWRPLAWRSSGHAPALAPTWCYHSVRVRALGILHLSAGILDRTN